jgi:hypothetical protein
MAKLKELSLSNAEMIERLTAKGYMMSQLAELFCVSKRTFERRIAESPELKRALSKGRVVRRMSVLQSFYDMATSGDNFTATRGWLVMFDKWEPDSDQDTREQLNSVECDFCAPIRKMTDEQVKAELAQIKKEAAFGVYSELTTSTY